MDRFRFLFMLALIIVFNPEKTAELSPRHQWFSREKTSEKLAQKFHTDDAHHPDLGSASDWSCRVGNLLQPIRSITQTWVVKGHQYGISVAVARTSFRRGTSGVVAKCQVFSHVNSL